MDLPGPSPSPSLSMRRRPTAFCIPSLHLGSFEGLSPDAYSLPSPTPSTLVSTRTATPPVTSRASFDTPGSITVLEEKDRVRRVQRHPEGNRLQLPLPPPTIALPPLPVISPISPFHASPADAEGGSMAAAAVMPALPTPPTMIKGLDASPAPRSRPSTAPSPSSTPRPDPKKPSGPSLTVHIPRSTTPPPILPDIIRDSPGIARRRTVVDGNRTDPGIRMSQVMGSTELPTVDLGMDMEPMAMPVARPTPPVDSPAQFSPRRLEKKQSMEDLRNASPTSPTPRRSLPRPPQQGRQPPPPLNLLPSSSRPLPSPTRPTGGTAQNTQTARQPKKSASTMPIVGGLADAGPYPGVPRPTPAGPALGLGRPAPVRRQPPQEEVCIECMMRDRDLADVVVAGAGVWERESDLSFEDLKAREMELLKSVGSGSVTAHPPSLDHSTDSEDDSTSLPSTNHSFDDLESRRRAAAKQQKRAIRREVDWRIAKELGWKGFKWEEGSAGEGLPRGFRGGRGGPLSEQAIKGVMAKFPHASAHRAKYMENFLYHQAILVREIRAEAQRLGHYPAPGETPVPTTNGQTIVAGPRTSSVAWSQKHARDLGEQIREGPSTPIATVRPSPSSPGNLANLAARPHIPPPSRPHTQFYPEPVSRSPGSVTRRSLGSAKTLDQSLRLGDDWADGDSEIWPPISPAESGLRPFSFAVRAGATGVRGSSDGHARKSFLGRWGGSVTSFFGGSQGGSGSMMDMHLGLDNDRQNRAASNYAHSHPRAVSMASPTRPSFFNRESRAASIHEGGARERERRMPKSVSTSRLSQVLRTEEPDPIPQPEKKKGLKGLLHKMKPKTQRKESTRYDTIPRPTPDSSDVAIPLAPPPNMAFLVGRGDRRERSGSTSTMVTDNSSVPGRGPAVLPYGMRSVSAPQTGSSSGGSQSNSPTSSRYRRESYASNADAEKRTSGMEMLSANVPLHTSTYPPPTFRPHNKTTSSLSNSSLLMPTLETPPDGVNGANAFFQQSPAYATPISSPNKFKNLPPLPPPDNPVFASSPDSRFSQHVDYSLAGPAYGNTPQSHSRNSAQGFIVPSPGSFAANSPRGYAQPRASYDTASPRPNLGTQGSARMAKSMYGQPSAQGSAGSFGAAIKGDDGKGSKRRGLKSLFGGGARAGRVA